MKYTSASPLKLVDSKPSVVPCIVDRYTTPVLLNPLEMFFIKEAISLSVRNGNPNEQTIPS